MGIEVANGRVIIEGVVGVEEAEALIGVLLEHPEALLDMARCEHVHAAVAQVLLTAGRAVARMPGDERLAAILNLTSRPDVEESAPIPTRNAA